MKRILILLIVVALFSVSCVSQKKVVDQTSQEKQMEKDETGSTKLCALTFDDGPDAKKTALVLDRLEKYGIIASFFVVGQHINDSTRGVLQRAVEMGCEINNHSRSYSGMSTMTADQVKESVDKTTAAIEEYTGTTPGFFRSPNLSASATMYKTIDLPFASGVLGYDWAGQNTSAEDRAARVMKGMRDGAIILLHDVQPDPHPTPEALDILIPELKKQGYEFVTLSELFKLKGVTPSPHEKKMWVYVK